MFTHMNQANFYPEGYPIMTTFKFKYINTNDTTRTTPLPTT